MKEDELMKWKKIGYLLAFMVEFIGCLFCFLILERPIPMILGIVLGTAAGFLSFEILFRTAAKVTEMEEPDQARSYAVSRYWIRLLCYVIIFLVAVWIEGVNEWGTIFGIFAFNIIFSISSFVNKIGKKESV